MRLASLIALALALPMRGVAQQSAPRATSARAPAPLTRAERTGYTETSRYDDVMAFLREVTRGQRTMRLTRMGYTGETRRSRWWSWAVPAMRARRRCGARASSRSTSRATSTRGRSRAKRRRRSCCATWRPAAARWLDSLVLLVAPIYNADGNERVSLTNRPLQLGPIGGEGQRANAAGLDLNRDHMKLETAEARSQVLLLRQYDPAVAIDSTPPTARCTATC